MKYIVYVSQAKKAFTTAELAALLEKSRKNNTRDGVTGLLIYRYNDDYKRGNFLQVLEGESAQLDAVWARISDDKRHHTIIVLNEGDIEKRMFAGWSMGFRNVDASDMINHPGFSELGSDEFWAAAKEKTLPDALDTLRSFYDAI